MTRRPAVAALMLAGLLGLGAIDARAQAVVWLRPPALADVVWRGMLPAEGTGVSAGMQMLYPAPGLAGFLAAIATHAAINQGVQSAQRQREQDEANSVLEPYQPTVRAWPAAALWAATMAFANTTLTVKAWDVGQAQGSHPVIDLTPTFTLAQDAAVLVADVAIKRTAAPGEQVTDTFVRVVSAPHSAADARAHWLADDGARLKTLAARMLAHALALGEQHGAKAEAEPPARTHRYLQGNLERSERAQMLAGDCSRAVLRTLRGWLLSVPLGPQDGVVCASTSAF